MNLSKERLEEALEKADVHIARLAAAVRRLLKDGCLDPRLLCVLQAIQALEAIGAARRTPVSFPVYMARRNFDDKWPHGYKESDEDYVKNNLELAVGLLDAYGTGKIPTGMICEKE